MKKKNAIIGQFVRFGIVGISNTIISYIIYIITLVILNWLKWCPDIDYLIAQATMFILSVAWSFYWNNHFVFIRDGNRRRNVFFALIKSYVLYSFSVLFLNGFLLTLWIEKLEISKYYAPVINLIINVPINFLLNKFWTFRDR